MRRPATDRRPPRLGRWLLRRALPAGLVAEGIAGDLEQEYARRPRRLWYLRQVVTIVLCALRDRLRGQSWFADGATPRGGAPNDRRERPGDPALDRGALWGEPLLQDVRLGVRVLARRPLFTATAVATLAIGMGVNTAIFSVVNGLLLRPIPAISEPETLVEMARDSDDGLLDVAWGAFETVRADTTTLAGVAGWDGITLAYRDAGDSESQVMSGREVTGNYFEVLGVAPAAGRFFDPARFWPDVDAEVVITHHLAQRRYGGAADAVGRQVLVNGTPVTIIGVAPAGFAGHQVIVQHDIFVPIGMAAPGMVSAAELRSVRGGSLALLGRTAEGTSIDAVREEMTALGDRFFAEHGIDEPYGLRVAPYGGVPASDRAMVTLFFGLLLLITAMVTAVACVNVANMLLSRALERRREIGIRMSLGAGRGRVARQLLTESMLLFLAAAALGVALSTWTTDTLVRLYLPRLTSTRLLLDVSPDARVFSFAALVALATGVLFGLTPALGATRMAAGGPRAGGSGPRAAGLRSGLVAAQMALTVVLLVGAGLVTRTLAALQAIDLGFDVAGVYVVELDLEHAGYDAAQARRFYERLLDEARGLPGISGIAVSRKLPMDSRSIIDGIHADGVEAPSVRGFTASFNRVSPGYFATAGIPLLAGRGFESFDDEGAPPVAVVNATMASRLWGQDGALGRRFTIGSGATARSYRVVGVAADAHYHTFVEEPSAFLYLAAAQSPDTIAHVLIRGDLEATVGAVRATIARLDADVPVVEVATVRQIVDGFSMGERLAAWVASIVGLLALGLGAVGVYGVTAFAVGRRAHEIGVRMALGAHAADVQRLMLRSGMRAPLAGLAAGLALAAAAAQLIGSFLYGVSTLDPGIYATVALILMLVALLATMVPARRAAMLDPLETLRSD
jgi:predicted permease